MHRLATFLALLAALAGCATAPPGRAPSPVWVSIDGAMLQFLDSIHDGLSTEILLCLDGELQGDVVRVSRFRATPVQYADRVSVRYDPCEPREFVGIVHSHPAGGGCYLSLVDEGTAKRMGHEIDLVVCGGGVFAWATKGASGIIMRRGS